MWGLLEHRIRSLPHVVSCSITPQGLTALIDTAGDASAVLATVEQVARAAGFEDPVRVIGGKGTAVVPFVTPKRVAAASIFAASLAGAATLMTSVFGTSVGPPDVAQAFEPEFRRPGTTLAAGPAEAPIIRVTSPRDAGPRPDGPRLSAPEEPARPALRTGRRSILDGAPATGGRQSSPQPREATHTKKTKGAAENDSCASPPDRGAPRARHGRHQGNGPRPWSRSVLVPPPDCDR